MLAKTEKTKKQGINFSSLLSFINKWGTVIAVVLLILFFSITMPHFITSSNILTILRSISIVTVIAIGLTIALTVDGLDLSIGSTATFANSLVVSMFVWYSMSTLTSIVLALGIALIVGAVNAFIIVKVKIPDLLATLSTLFIFEGVAMTYTGGGSISEGMPRLDGTPTEGVLTPGFKLIGQAPYIIIIMFVVVIVVHIFLNYTKHGVTFML